MSGVGGDGQTGASKRLEPGGPQRGSDGVRGTVRLTDVAGNVVTKLLA